MADTFTPNYNLVLPGIGGDVNTWGTLLNQNFSAIDTAMFANLDTAGTRSMAGNLKVKKANPAIALIDTSQVLPAGAWQWESTGNVFELLRNTAAAGDFSTNTVPISFDNTDSAHILGSITSGQNVTVGGTLSVGSTVSATGSISTAASSVSVGTGSLAVEMDYVLHNSNTLGQLFLTAAGLVGFSDTTRALVRFSSDTVGNFTAAGNVTAFSDERIKCEWQDVPPDIVERAAVATAGTYTRKDTGGRQAGVVAQEWLDILGEVVGVDEASGLYTMAYGNAALVLACALARRVMALEVLVRDKLK